MAQRFQAFYSQLVEEIKHARQKQQPLSVVALQLPSQWPQNELDRQVVEIALRLEVRQEERTVRC